MIRAIVGGCLRLRGVLALASCALLVWGYVAARDMPLDVFPDFVPPQVSIQTEAPGLSAEEVEALVTRPVEGAVNGAGALEALRSQSIQGLSIVDVVFVEGTDVFRARALLAERLNEIAGELPRGVAPPRMTPLTSSTMDLLKIGLASERLTPLELRSFAQWTLRPRLLSVPGVSNVSLFGGEVRQIQVQIDPVRLEALQLTLQDVVRAASEATGVRAAGFVENDNQRIVLELQGQAASSSDLSRAVVERRGERTVLLGDVANVVEAGAPAFGDALIMGRPGVLVTMLSQYGANTMGVTRDVEAALAELAPALRAAGIEVLPRLHRPATFIENAIGNLRHSLWIGAALVAGILLVFLLDLRTALISLLAIPLSLLSAVLVLHLAGATLNTITLGGLAIALGEVVDDAIIDVENILRRLRENRARGLDRSAFQVVLEASLEVRGAVVYATFVVALVFLPVLTLSGLQGRMFAPLAQAYLLAVLASLIVALTITPALALILLGGRAGGSREHAPLTRVKHLYASGLRRMAARPALIALVVVCLVGTAGFAATRLRLEFLPEFREGHFVAHVSAAPGTSIAEMKRIGTRVAHELLDTGVVASVAQQIGRAEQGEDPWGPNRSELHIELVPLDPAGEIAAHDAIRVRLAAIPGVRFDVLTFLGDRIGESISGENAAVVASISGDDLDVLDGKADEVARVLGGIRGATDVQRGSLPGLPTLAIQPLPERLAAFGLRPIEVLDTIETAFAGTRVAQLYTAGMVTDVVVILDPAARREPESVARLPLRLADGTSVPLSAIADVRLSSGRAIVQHEGGVRRVPVTCNVSGRDVDGFVEEARARVARDVQLPRGTYLSFGGAAEAGRKAREELLLHAGFAALGILLLLWIAFRSTSRLLLVLVNVPFALVGGVAAALIGGGVLSMGSLVGFVTLFGITMRNSIMLISHYQHLVQHEGAEWNLATALRGAAERFTPILMTALVTCLALLPLVISGATAGREIESPMAAVILGGLVTSTLLNLLVLPVFANAFGRFGTRADES